MGATLSKPNKSESDVKRLADNLFKFMYTQWDQHEIWEIAEKSDEYIIELSDLIHHHMTVIGYETGTGGRGEIYVKRIEKYKKDINDLPRLSDVDKKLEREERKRNAQAVAFFFVRIFQILGAMLLIILEPSIEELSEKSGYLLEARRPGVLPRVTGNIYDKEYENRILREQLEQMRRGATARGGQRQRGGALGPEHTLGLFEAFRNYLNLGEDKKSFNFTKNVSINNILQRDTKETSADLNFKIQPGPEKKFTMTISKLDTSSAEDNYIITISYKTTTVMLTLQKIGYKYGFTPRGSPATSISEGINSETNITNTSISRYLENFLLRFVNNHTGDRTKPVALQYPAERGEISSNLPLSRTGSLLDPNKLPGVIKDTYKLLIGKETSFCKARALRLLDARSILDGISTNSAAGYVSKTQICSADTSETEGEKSLQAYRRTESLGQLYGTISRARMDKSKDVIQAFVETKSPTYNKSMPQLNLIDGVLNEEFELQKTLDQLATVFEKAKEPVTSFAELKLKKTTKCKDFGSKEIKSDALARELYRIANLILQKHNESKVRITEFLENMFTINPGSLEVTGIKESVLILGQNGLDLLTRQARELVKENMIVCENLFQQGVKVWENDPTNEEPARETRTNGITSEEEASGKFREIVAQIGSIMKERSKEEAKLGRSETLSEDKKREYRQNIEVLISQLRQYIQKLLETGDTETMRGALLEQLRGIELENLVPPRS